MRSVVTDALSVLREFAAPAHLFLSTNSVGRTNRWQGQPADAPIFDMLDWKDIEVLRSHGVYIEGHSVNHPDLRTLSDDEIEAECCVANEHIRRRLGSPPRYFAFPYGHCDARVRSITCRHYAACVTTELRPLGYADDTAALPRLDTYYLRSAYFYRNLDTRVVRAYLAIRNIIRRARNPR